MRQKLEVGQRVTALDLAQALENNDGTFMCQQAGQAYLAVSKPGHSITSLRPVGIRIPQAVSITVGQEPWVIEKVSELGISFDTQASR